MRQGKTKIIITSIILIAFALIAVLMRINEQFTPASDGERNRSTTGITMRVHLEDAADRTPVIRTFTRDEYDQLDAGQRNQIKNEIRGSIEGDVPMLDLKNDGCPLEFSFGRLSGEGDGSSTNTLIPEENPSIGIALHETLYSPEVFGTLSGLLTPGEAEGVYYSDICQLVQNEETSLNEGETPYRISMYIEVGYRIEGKDYVSVFAVNAKSDPEH